MTGQKSYLGSQISTILQLKRAGKSNTEIADLCNKFENFTHPAKLDWTDQHIGYVHVRYKEEKQFNAPAPGVNPSYWYAIEPKCEQKPRAEKPVNPISYTHSPEIRQAKKKEPEGRKLQGFSNQDEMYRPGTTLRQPLAQNFPSQPFPHSYQNQNGLGNSGPNAQGADTFGSQQSFDNMGQKIIPDQVMCDPQLFNPDMNSTSFNVNWQQTLSPNGQSAASQWVNGNPSYPTNNQPSNVQQKQVYRQAFASQPNPQKPQYQTIMNGLQRQGTSNIHDYRAGTYQGLQNPVGSTSPPFISGNEAPTSNFSSFRIAGSGYMLPQDRANNSVTNLGPLNYWPVGGTSDVNIGIDTPMQNSTNTASSSVQEPSYLRFPDYLDPFSIQNGFNGQIPNNLPVQNQRTEVGDFQQVIASRNVQNALAPSMRSVSGGPIRSSLQAAQPMNILNAGLPAPTERRMLQHAVKAQMVGMESIQQGTSIIPPFSEMPSSPYTSDSAGSRQSPAIAVAAQHKAMQAARNLVAKMQPLARGPSISGKPMNLSRNNTIFRHGPVRNVLPENESRNRNGSAFGTSINMHQQRPQSTAVPARFTRPGPYQQHGVAGTTQMKFQSTDPGVPTNARPTTEPQTQGGDIAMANVCQDATVSSNLVHNVLFSHRNNVSPDNNASNNSRKLETPRSQRGNVVNPLPQKTPPQEVLQKPSFDPPSTQWLEQNDVFSSPGPANQSTQRFNEKLRSSVQAPTSSVQKSEVAESNMQHGAYAGYPTPDADIAALLKTPSPNLRDIGFSEFTQATDYNHDDLNSFDFGFDTTTTIATNDDQLISSDGPANLESSPIQNTEEFPAFDYDQSLDTFNELMDTHPDFFKTEENDEQGFDELGFTYGTLTIPDPNPPNTAEKVRKDEETKKILGDLESYAHPSAAIEQSYSVFEVATPKGNNEVLQEGAGELDGERANGNLPDACDGSKNASSE